MNPAVLRHITFLIGDRCNAECVMCWQAKRRAETPKSEWRPETPVAVVEAALKKHAADLFAIELVSYGETMMSPDFHKMVAAVHAAGKTPGRSAPIGLSLITNGSLLDEGTAEIMSLPGEMTVSIDAADKDLYEKIRVGLNWEHLVANLELAIRHPRRHKDRAVGINMTVFEDNVMAVEQMGAFAVRLGVNYLAILHGAALDRSFAAGREIGRRDPRLVAQVARLRRRFPKFRINDFATIVATQNMTAGKCNLPWQHMDVGTDLRAHPCCRSHYTDLGAPDTSFRGPVMERLRAQILADSVDSVEFADCAKCEMLGARVKPTPDELKRLPVVKG